MTDPTPNDPPWDDPVAVVSTDRLCTGCGGNLAGRPIAREPRYGLLATRCPSCGRVAAFEEFPPQGAWMRRWALLIAGLWLTLLMSVAVAGLGLTTGVTIGVAAGVTDHYDGRLRSAHRAWIDQQRAADEDADVSFARFWSESSVQLRPARRDFDRADFALIVLPCIAAAVSGIFWSLALLQWRVPRLLIGGLLVVVGVELLLFASRPVVTILGGVNSGTVAWRTIWQPLASALYIWVGVVFLIMLAISRPLARGVVRAFVPPPLRGALSRLWRADGLTPPGPEHATSEQSR